MNEILSVGLILLAALIAGHLAQLVHIPEVTGYLLVGLLIGPGGFDLISDRNLETLGFLSEIALGLILFSIGSIFEASTFRRVGPGMVRVTVWEATAAFALVLFGTRLAGQAWPTALLLGVIAMETAPATTLMILREYDARGPMTDRLRALIALNNMYVLIVFGLVAAALGVALAPGEKWLGHVGRAGFGLVWSIVGSTALGVLLGLVIDTWARRVRESGEALILAMGFVLVAVGGARLLGLSPLFASLALGATVANTSRNAATLLEGLSRADPPLYAAFFVLAGAELDLENLGALGRVGVAYLVLRGVGKVAGVRWALRRQDVPETVRRYLGQCILASSSLAVGLVIQVRNLFPALAPDLSAVVLAAVLIYEIVGPLLARRALFRAGEAQTTPDPLADSDASLAR